MGPLPAEAATRKMHGTWPRDMFKSPLNDIVYLENTAASKSILPEIFSAAGMDIGKQEYYRLAEEMQKEEIPSEVAEKFDEIQRHWES